MEISGNAAQMKNALRLIDQVKRLANQFKGQKVGGKLPKEDLEMEEDQVQIRGNLPFGTGPIPETEYVKNRLEYLAGFSGSNTQSSGPEDPQIQVEVVQVVEQEAVLRYAVLEKIEGLIRRSNTVAETDRYRFDFMDGTTFKITDKWTTRSTTIWGDPHVDLDDVEGNMDGDFLDLKGSDSHTTLMLQDGTRLTFTARDDGLIEAVDIFKGNQHISGIGQGSLQWNEKDGLFDSQVDNSGNLFSWLPKGDIVFAGGDGNDWFTSEGKLLWGKTTGLMVSARPYAVLQWQYREKFSQQISIQI